MDPLHLHIKSEVPEHLDRVVSQEDLGEIHSEYYRSKLFVGTVSAVAISLICVSLISARFGDAGYACSNGTKGHWSVLASSTYSRCGQP